ncbi:uncharacterized protein EDB91DRAFT_1127424 [Suillus paluster]|uniref:uncharacterized protein n=1 Tax=Suillus paluster TaxID=48578 RepID=UPI001B8739E6|nr:uncharacterized protein EDB91DRAFT_1127424 [Suillus paluster]KAG1742675.1 hypothetical protein EDB91DRAFT_1127424 [Suillus paluster]
MLWRVLMAISNVLFSDMFASIVWIVSLLKTRVHQQLHREPLSRNVLLIRNISHPSVIHPALALAPCATSLILTLKRFLVMMALSQGAHILEPSSLLNLHHFIVLAPRNPSSYKLNVVESHNPQRQSTRCTLPGRAITPSRTPHNHKI